MGYKRNLIRVLFLIKIMPKLQDSEYYRKRQRTIGEYFAKKAKQVATGAVVGGALGGVTGAGVGAVEGMMEDAGPSNVYEDVNMTDAFSSRKKKYNMAKMTVRRKTKSKGKKKAIKRNNKRVSKKRGRKGKGKSNKITLATLQKRGVTISYEKRKTTTAVNDTEAVVIGHTSMPSKVLTQILWRAIIKHILIKINYNVKDYGHGMVGEGFIAGDKFLIKYYDGFAVSSLSEIAFTVAADSTFDKMCNQFVVAFGGSTLDDRSQERIDEVQFFPATGSKFPKTNLNLSGLKISINLRSLLKLQNITNETANDNEADDITRVPLIGKKYLVKGDNFMKKANSVGIDGLYTAENNDAIYASFTKQTPTTSGPYEYYSATDNSTFNKPSEPPKKYEIANCIKMENAVINPGAIMASTLTENVTFSLQWFYQFLYGTKAAITTQKSFDSRLGRTSVIYLEKVVGKKGTAANHIKLWTELEMKVSALVHGPYNLYTLPIQYQIDYDP